MVFALSKCVSQLHVEINNISIFETQMSLKYFTRFQFNGVDLSVEDFGKRDLAVATLKSI